MNVSVIIVSYNTKEMLARCLESVFRETSGLDFEVIVSDNASTDGSVDMVKKEFPAVILIENERNLGFGAANNRGLPIAAGEFVFYLNSDTILLNNAVKMFHDFWKSRHEENAPGALGCFLVGRDRRPVHSGGKFPSAGGLLQEKLAGGFSRSAPPLPSPSPQNMPVEVDYVCGADLFLKNDEYARFDERFFLYCEDADLQYRLHLAGKKRLLIPGPEIVHLEGGSNSAPRNAFYGVSFSQIQARISDIQFFRKKGDNRFAIFLVKMMTLARWLNPRFLAYTGKYLPAFLRL